MNSSLRPRILVPVSFGRRSRSVYLHACGLAALWDAELVLLHVMQERRLQMSAAREPAAGHAVGLDALGWLHVGADQFSPHNPLETSANLQLRDWAALARGVDMTTELREGDVVDEIVSVVRESSPTLIALPTPAPLPRGWWPRPYESTILARLLPKLECPVFLLPRDSAALGLLSRPQQQQPLGVLRHA